MADALCLPATRVRRLVEERGVKRTRSQTAKLAHRRRASEFVPEERSAAPQAAVLERCVRGQSGELIAELLELPAPSVCRQLGDRGAGASAGYQQAYAILRIRGILRSIGETKRLTARRERQGQGRSRVRTGLLDRSAVIGLTR